MGSGSRTLRTVRPLVAAGAVWALLAGTVAPELGAQPTRECTVRRVVDGDTFVCRDGERVRLLLVDTPEMGDAPLGRLARRATAELIPPGTRVRLELGVQERDRYRRLLAHVRLPDGRTLNRVLARQGYARVMVVPPNVDGAEAIRAAVDSARLEGAGLWAREGFGGRPGPGGGPERAGEGARGGRPGEAAGGPCHPSYPGVCIPPPPPDLDCGDVDARAFEVVGSDPHRFDGDGDGVGCEGGGRPPA